MSHKTATVYMVDDDSSFRKSLRRLVTAMGFHVIDFESAQSFLNETKYQTPACLILDINLPVMDGFDLHDQLIRQGVKIPVIFVTGQANVTLSVQAMKKGAVDFLQKPFSSQQIEQAINHAIELDQRGYKRRKTDI